MAIPKPDELHGINGIGKYISFFINMKVKTSKNFQSTSSVSWQNPTYSYIFIFMIEFVWTGT